MTGDDAANTGEHAPRAPRSPRRGPGACAVTLGILLSLVAARGGAQPQPAVAPAGPCVDPGPSAPIPAIALKEIASGLRAPVHVTSDGSARLFVVEQHGVIRIIEDGKLLAKPFLDITRRVESGGEKGLLSIAFHPRYADNGQFYLNYTARRDGLQTIVARYARRSPHEADPASEQVLLTIAQPYSNHNGGQLAFGPDGYLYIGMGDGGSANDPYGHGQNLATLLGALLRIDVDRQEGAHRYAIPPDNPFVTRPGARPEIYAYGLRNPWRFAFDAATGRLFLADVGQDEVEEIDVVRKGGNYGWNIMEGDICTPAVNPKCDPRGLEPPIHTYRHPEGFSVTGGFVYRGRDYPALCGVYLFADYVSQRLWGLRYDGQRVTAVRELFGGDLLDRTLGRLRGEPRPHVASFGEDQRRELYVADHRGGRIYQIVAPR